MAGEANSSKCSLMHYSQKKTVLVLRRPVYPGNSQISSNCVGLDVAHASLAEGNKQPPAAVRWRFS